MHMSDSYNRDGERRPMTRAEYEARKKRLQRKRKFRVFLFFTLLALGIIVIISPIIILTAFRVKNIKVEGNVPYSEKEIISVSGTAIGKNLVTADGEKIAESIENSLPYVLKVNVTKKLPGTLVLELTKATEDYAVYLDSDKTYLLLDRELNILKTSAVCPKGAAVIRCPAPVSKDAGEALSFAAPAKKTDDKDAKETTDTVLNVLKRITSAVRTEKISGITAIDLRSLADIQLVYEGRILLRLGALSDIPQKINLAAKVLQEENGINPKQFGTMNLTITQKAYFKPDAFSYLMPGELPEPEEPEETDGEDGENADEDEEENDRSDEDEEDYSDEDENGGGEDDYSGDEDAESNTRSYEADEDEVG